MNEDEARYLGGVAAGLKIQQLLDEGALTAENFDADGNVKLGYVGAFPYAEVISGYSAFFLGARSVSTKVMIITEASK